ncbi:MAG: hypothetical protein H0T12_03660 [Actinobacteria bacterium]|nr:hypothetical protein [Actinomycetota bacterium]
MSDEERRAEEQAERSRPRIVDKRVSARRPQDAPPSPRIDQAAGRDPTQGPDRPSVAEPSGAVQPPSAPPQAPPQPPTGGPPTGDGGAERIWTPEEEAEAQRIAQEIAARPSLEWVVNVAVTLANVAGTKLDQGDATDARLAIDALAGIVNGAGTSLGDAENPLRQTLAQLQLAYAQAMGPPTP